MTDELFLDIYGIITNVIATDSGSRVTLEGIAKDFAFFTTSKAPDSAIRIFLHQSRKSGNLDITGRKSFSTRMCKVYDMGSTRICDYGDGAVVIAEHSKAQKIFKVFNPREDELYEVSFTLILSAVGEALDEKCFHRVHALGFELKQQTCLAILPRGAGKSAISLLLCKNPNFKLYSDENPLVLNNNICAFPLHQALRPEVAENLSLNITSTALFRRRLFPAKAIFHQPIEQIAKPNCLRVILIGKPAGNESPSLAPAGFLTTFCSLLKALVLGIGLCQMAEHMLRLNNLMKLSMIFFSRLKTAFYISTTVQSFHFFYARDARLNAQFIETAFPLSLKTKAPNKEFQTPTQLI